MPTRLIKVPPALFSIPTLIFSLSLLVNSKSCRVWLSPFPAYVSFFHGSFTSRLISFLLYDQVPFTLTPDAQIVPQNMNVALGGVAANIYLIVQKNGHNSGSGVDFTFGMLAIQRFYCVLDTGNQRIGFAQKPDTNANVTVNLIWTWNIRYVKHTVLILEFEQWMRAVRGTQHKRVAFVGGSYLFYIDQFTGPWCST